MSAEGAALSDVSIGVIICLHCSGVNFTQSYGVDQTKTRIIEIGQRRLVAPNLASYSNFRQHRFSAVD